MLEERIIELEIRIAFQEDQLEQLNQIVTKQQLEMTDNQKILKVYVEQLRGFMESAEETGGGGDQAPPHY